MSIDVVVVKSSRYRASRHHHSFNKNSVTVSLKLTDVNDDVKRRFSTSPSPVAAAVKIYRLERIKSLKENKKEEKTEEEEGILASFFFLLCLTFVFFPVFPLEIIIAEEIFSSLFRCSRRRCQSMMVTRPLPLYRRYCRFGIPKKIEVKRTRR